MTALCFHASLHFVPWKSYVCINCHLLEQSFAWKSNTVFKKEAWFSLTFLWRSIAILCTEVFIYFLFHCLETSRAWKHSCTLGKYQSFLYRMLGLWQALLLLRLGRMCCFRMSKFISLFTGLTNNLHLIFKN